MSAQADPDRFERLVAQAREAQEEARRLIEEARADPLSAESLAKLRQAHLVVLRAAALLDEAAGSQAR